jgi:hypothetical protein
MLNELESLLASNKVKQLFPYGEGNMNGEDLCTDYFDVFSRNLFGNRNEYNEKCGCQIGIRTGHLSIFLNIFRGDFYVPDSNLNEKEIGEINFPQYSPWLRIPRSHYHANIEVR